MRAFILLLVLISLPAFAGELLRLESHTKIIEKFGPLETQRRIEGFDQQRRLRINVAEYKLMTGFAEPRVTYMIGVKHPDREEWQAQPITKEEFQAVSQVLLSTQKNSFLNRLAGGCRADLVIGKHRVLVSAARDCLGQ